MNTDQFAGKLAQALNIPDNKSNIVLKIFKEKIYDFLSVGETIKIENLGIFQLKEQLSHSGSSRVLEPKNKDLTLVYSPTEEHSDDFLFINLDKEKVKKDETEFDENVFQLGIGKSLVIEPADSVDSEEQTEYKNIGQGITVLLEGSEKIKDFDLWEDHLKVKETKNMLDEEADSVMDSVEKNKEDEILNIDDEESEDAADFLEEEFEPVTNEDLLEDYIQDNKIIPEDDDTDGLKEIILDREEGGSDPEEFLEEEGIKTDLSELDEIGSALSGEDDKNFESPKDLEKIELNEIDLESDDYENASADEVSESEVMKKVGDEFENKDIAVEGTKDDITEPVKLEKEEISDDRIDQEDFDELEKDAVGIDKDAVDELEKDGEDYNEKVSTETDSNVENIEDETGEFVEKDIDDELDEIELEETEELEKPVVESEAESKSNKGLIIALISMFIIVAAISVYYFMLGNRDDASIQQNRVTEEITEDKLDQPSAISGNEISTIKEDESVPKSSNENNLQDNKLKVITKESPLIIDSPNVEDSEVAKNIYFDGATYSIQISSWKQKNIAEREAKKLIDKGYPAFIYKIYIAKFDGTWHRVRVGPFKSLNQAKSVQEQLK